MAVVDHSLQGRTSDKSFHFRYGAKGESKFSALRLRAAIFVDGWTIAMRFVATAAQMPDASRTQAPQSQ
jgi:hypothetical protein